MACCEPQNQYLPASATAGLPFQATVALADYPAPAWTLTAYIRGPKSIDLTASASAGAHLFAADAATTAEWPAGQYWYALRASNAGQLVEIERGQINIAPDLATAADGYDGRSANQIALDAINAVLAKRATLDQERYRINNRELYRTSIKDLLTLKSYYATAVRNENACKSGGKRRFGRPIHVHFSPR